MKLIHLILVFFFFIGLSFSVDAQPRTGKYQGLLWEISKPGMKKNSYLFGTMHVSRKLAFQLSDSFYVGLQNVDMVALETNPETWQGDMDQYAKDYPEADYGDMSYYRNFSGQPSDYLNINTLKIRPYQKQLEDALSSNPSTINNLLYRTYGNDYGDFEEDTYLDLYIYQCGKRLNKMVAGVEKFDESMRLMKEAYMDAAKDRNVKDRGVDLEDQYSQGRLQEAYKSGNLDWVDSINRYNSTSAAFDEKFLYQRNNIQAASIDSILRSGKSLFVGVGAAHLPGERGVIEILRKQGYTLRSVKTIGRDRVNSERLQTLRVPVKFSTQSSIDGFFNADIPGVFYKSEKLNGSQQWQYADMANGSYYMVSRVLTSAWAFNQSINKVGSVIDSLLYENIPGKILQKKGIVKFGYHGFDITNRTRRGDIQRYQIFSTPFEVIIFKMSGNGEYVSKGTEANSFFNSIKLKENKTTAWKKYSPATGGFSVSLPQTPLVSEGANWSIDAEDKSTNTQYRVIRTDIHNYSFASPDSFDLQLMEESFASSDVIDTLISRKMSKQSNGRPVLDCRYKGKQGDFFHARYIIRGPHYFTLIAHGQKETPVMQDFFDSFELLPFVYPNAKLKSDTSIGYTVISPVFPPAVKSTAAEMANYLMDDELSNRFKSKTISNDTTGEKIYLNSYNSSPYNFISFSSSDKSRSFSDSELSGDSIWIYKLKKTYTNEKGWKIYEAITTDSASSRAIWAKVFYKQGRIFRLSTQISLIDSSSNFLKSFFDTFQPADSLRFVDSTGSGSSVFLSDLVSGDSVRHARAIKNMYSVDFEEKDLPAVKMALTEMNWKQKNYIDNKKSLIAKLSSLESKQSSDFLNELYVNAGDTLEFQYAVLDALASQQTSYSYQIIDGILKNEPPILDISDAGYSTMNFSFYNNSQTGTTQAFMSSMTDSLKLTRSILKSILPLLNLDGYKKSVMYLLGNMVDSGLVKSKDYSDYYDRFLLEAKQELRKQLVQKKQAAIKKAEGAKDGEPDYYSYLESRSKTDNILGLYSKLLMPFEKKKAAVSEFMEQLFRTGDDELKYTLLFECLNTGRNYPDTLLKYFAANDQYRYELYTDLKEEKMLSKFPLEYNGHVLLGRSKLLYNQDSRIDSLVYLDKRSTIFKGVPGLVYFFKYREKKDDLSWKIASVGILPTDTTNFEFELTKSDKDNLYLMNLYTQPIEKLGETRIIESQPLGAQIDKELKRVLYSRYESSRQFYVESRMSWPLVDH